MKLVECQDDLTLLTALRKLWDEYPPGKPLSVSITLSELIPNEFSTGNVFDDPKRKTLFDSIDKINAKYGIQTVYFGTIHDIKEAAPTRIGFTNIPETFW